MTEQLALSSEETWGCNRPVHSAKAESACSPQPPGRAAASSTGAPGSLGLRLPGRPHFLLLSKVLPAQVCTQSFPCCLAVIC